MDDLPSHPLPPSQLCHRRALPCHLLARAEIDGDDFVAAAAGRPAVLRGAARPFGDGGWHHVALVLSRGATIGVTVDGGNPVSAALDDGWGDDHPVRAVRSGGVLVLAQAGIC